MSWLPLPHSCPLNIWRKPPYLPQFSKEPDSILLTVLSSWDHLLCLSHFTGVIFDYHKMPSGKFISPIWWRKPSNQLESPREVKGTIHIYLFRSSCSSHYKPAVPTSDSQNPLGRSIFKIEIHRSQADLVSWNQVILTELIQRSTFKNCCLMLSVNLLNSVSLFGENKFYNLKINILGLLWWSSG